MLVNADRLEDLMRMVGVDAIVATSPENVTYTSGYWALSQWIRRGPQTYVVWPRRDRGAPCIVASASLLDQLADQTVNVASVEKFGQFVIEISPGTELGEVDQKHLALQALPHAPNATAALVKSLCSLGLQDARIAIDEMGLAPSLDKYELTDLPNLKITPGFELLRRVRAVKTAEEIDRLRMAAQITEASIDAALAIAKVGVSELELAEAFNVETIRHGGIPVLYCIGTGPRSAMPNVQPSDRKLQEGDIIRFDAGGRYQHYRADIARNAVLGEPTEKIKTYHQALWKGVECGIAMFKPGTRCRDIFEAVVATVRKEGIPHYARTHVGHGIGLDGYDLPNLTPNSEDILEEGMVLCVETPYYELGFGGLQVENTVAVGKDGPISLMKNHGKLRIV